MNKRGIFFTILVILIFSLFLASFTFYSGIKERKTTQKRVESMNSFLLSVEEDLPRKLFVSGFRSIFILETKIIDSGNYISNPESRMEEMIFNGTLDGESQELMLGATYPEIISSVQERADKINVNLTLGNPVFSVEQEDPWNVKFTLEVDLSMQDKSGLASWSKTETITAYVPVQNFEDPIYVVNTNGLVINKIIRSPYSVFVSGNDYTNLSLHSENSYYIADSDAPSFIDRLQGVISESPNGIESLVNLQELSQKGINVQDKTVVDHIYFSSSNPSSCFVQGMPSWFKLDTSHLEVYNATCS
ncbi:hypothetical protein CO038_01030 [Candidatus Pacearchaeota archaeon CG_4_9_14_0_2_um_filter_39_13]|nr:hypothetical protein [Candidatus Pacearchaeota archaeon]PJC44959.1 MAG: hypothetical protein CO038_01030 [Candidatus Pacearchaeota archaeon CG_4_9_14_0_2_um_filter_39_13]